MTAVLELTDVSVRRGDSTLLDGVSWRVLLPDLAAAYTALDGGGEPDLTPVGTSFGRWSQALYGAQDAPTAHRGAAQFSLPEAFRAAQAGNSRK